MGFELFLIAGMLLLVQIVKTAVQLLYWLLKVTLVPAVRHFRQRRGRAVDPGQSIGTRGTQGVPAEALLPDLISRLDPRGEQPDPR